MSCGSAGVRICSRSRNAVWDVGRSLCERRRNRLAALLRVSHVTNPAITSADVIKIFAVTPRAIEPEFVKTRSTSEDEILAKQRMVGELDSETGKYKSVTVRIPGFVTLSILSS
jgi:phage head maturation protease